MFLRNIFQKFQHSEIRQAGLHSLSALVFCFVIFDGLLAFAIPILIVRSGISESMMGIIIGLSSLFGAIFDLLICIFIKTPNYRKFFLLMLILGLGFPLVLWEANSILFFIVAMAIWGLYYDFYNLGIMDFVRREVSQKESASSFGILRAFHSLGYIVAPLVAGIVIGAVWGGGIFIVAWFFLILGIIFFRQLLIFKKDTTTEKGSWEISNEKRRRGAVKELKLWFLVGKMILPLLLATCLLNIFDSAFWTIGPLISEESDGFISLGSLFIMSYQIPPLIVGGIIGKIIIKKNKRKPVAFLSLLLGSFIFMAFPILTEGRLILLASFAASFMIAIAWPSISAAYIDRINEFSENEKQIETLQDYFTNFGYVIGPILSGYLSQNFGHIKAFAYLGSIGVIISIILFVFNLLDSRKIHSFED